jgi:hypothetical protein
MTHTPKKSAVESTIESTIESALANPCAGTVPSRSLSRILGEHRLIATVGDPAIASKCALLENEPRCRGKTPLWAVMIATPGFPKRLTSSAACACVGAVDLPRVSTTAPPTQRSLRGGREKGSCGNGGCH